MYNCVRSIVLTAALTLVASPLAAGFAGTDVFLPSIGAKPGVAPAVWYTTVWVYNPNPTAACVTFSLLERQANPSPMTIGDSIPAGETRKYDNAVELIFGRQTFGALRISSAQKVLASARIYSQAGELKDSVGQFFAAIPAAFAIGLGQTTELLGAYGTLPSADSTFRYNFGLVETTGAGTCFVKVTVKDSKGAELGSKTYSLQQWEQTQKAFGTEFPTLSTENARLVVEVIGGNGKVIAFGSGVANGSQDPATYEMSFRDDLLGSGGGLASVSHDGTLTGDGTPTSPLGIANGTVTQAKLSTSGTPGAGKVLGTDGTNLQWQSTGLSLPYTSSVSASGGAAFEIENTSSSSTSIGVSGSSSRGNALYGTSSSGTGVYGRSTSGYAGEFLGKVRISHGDGFAVVASSDSGVGVDSRSTSSYGVQAISTSGIGLYAQSGGTYAGYFKGNIRVEGTIHNSAAYSEIDHPLDPAGKYLYHSFVASPDMMNIYNGTVTTNASGEAVVELPDWFEAFNREFRYQLTVVGAGDAWAQARVSHEIEGNRFTVQTSIPNTKVSWQVTGIRRDPYAEAHPTPLEVTKPSSERGLYLHPDLLGVPVEKSVKRAIRTE